MFTKAQHSLVTTITGLGIILLGAGIAQWAMQSGGIGSYFTILVFLVFSLGLHELGHGVAYLGLGAKRFEIHLSAAGLSVSAKPNLALGAWKQLFVLSASGLVVSLLLAGIGYLISASHPMFIINLAILLVNILPINNSDGQKILFAVLWGATKSWGQGKRLERLVTIIVKTLLVAVAIIIFVAILISQLYSVIWLPVVLVFVVLRKPAPS